MNIRQKLISIVLALGAVLAAPQFAHATVYGGSVDTTSTTLSAALTATQNGQVCVASATNINVTSISQAATFLVVDKEAIQVTTAGASSTCFNVKRGQLGSAVTAHLNSRTVWVGNVATGSGDSSRPFSSGAITATLPSGSCTAANQYSLPIVFVPAMPSPVVDAIKAYCTAGVWTYGQQTQSGGQTPFSAFSTPSLGAVTTNSTSYVVGSIFFGQIFIPANTNLTGACLLNGATIGTSKVIYALYDAAGNLLANTALAGTTTATASKYQCIAFTAAEVVTGPSSYFVAVQGDNVTDNFQTYAANGAPTNYGTQSQTGVFGTLPAMTTPTVTFTANKGPLMVLY